jgi:pimeloyl-ACP methyl ester carboxylesterase
VATFVLVHGGRHGGWCWRKVSRLLRDAGHDVFAPTLTGVGERRHLARPDVGLSTHVEDVVALLEFEDLTEVVLVGHSYGGMVITGVVERSPERVARLVYLDALVPEPGECVLDLLTAELSAALPAWVASDGDGWRVPSGRSTPADYGVTDPEDAAWVAARLTDQPFRSYQEPLQATAKSATLPRTYVHCTQSQSIDPRNRERVAGAAGWSFRELATGHDLMVSAPRQTAALLLEAAL